MCPSLCEGPLPITCCDYEFESCRSQWPSGAADYLLWLWFQILQIPAPPPKKKVAERSKARVCGRSLAGIAGSNQAGGMDVCVLCCKYIQMAKCRTIKTKKQIWMKYRVQDNRKNEISGGAQKSSLLSVVFFSGRCLCD